MWLQRGKSLWNLGPIKRSSKPLWLSVMFLPYSDAPYKKAKAAPLQVSHSNSYALWTLIVGLRFFLLGYLGCLSGNQDEGQIYAVLQRR